MRLHEDDAQWIYVFLREFGGKLCICVCVGVIHYVHIGSWLRGKESIYFGMTAGSCKILNTSMERLGATPGDNRA